MATIVDTDTTPTRGMFVPPWYKEPIPTMEDMNIISIIWGVSLACAGFTFVKAAKQTWCCLHRWRQRRRQYEQHQPPREPRSRKGSITQSLTQSLRQQKGYHTRPTRFLILNGYLVMVWAEWFVSFAFGIMAWFYLNPSLWVEGSFWIFFGFLCLWTVQMQCILQILVNRVSLLLLTSSDRRWPNRLRWGVALFVGLINVSCFVVWIPARLQISPEWIHVNKFWDRTEKAIFALADIGLNALFLYLVRTKLIDNGLNKYKRLFWTNSVAVFFSLSLDIILIGVMSLPDDAVYLQFHSLVYMLKLHIELNLAELLAKIVRASNELNHCRGGSDGSGQMNAVAIDDFDVYSTGGSSRARCISKTSMSGGNGGSNSLPSYPRGIRRNNSHNNYWDLELALSTMPDDSHHRHRRSGSWIRGSEEEGRSANKEARPLSDGIDTITVVGSTDTKEA